AEAAAAAAFQRLSIAKTQIEEEAGRIRSRQVELERRLQQLDADIAREERMVRDNADILERLRAEEAELNSENAELQRIETEARTLAKILNAASGDLFPSVLEQISVERGYETALGAALGEDLDVPLDRSAPVHWGESAVQPGDAALPEGVKSLASVVRAPAQLARRLAQIGIVDAAEGRRLQALL
ncbi:MAG: chromosome segregation protein SMC, partial [Mesorhizobium sp.]